MYFLNHNAHTSPLFRDLNILKLPDKIALENCFFINKYFKKCLSTIFKNCFTFSSYFHTYNTCWSNLGCIVLALLYRNCPLIFKHTCCFSKHSVLFSRLIYRCFITLFSTRIFDYNCETFYVCKFISCVLKSEYILLIDRLTDVTL